MIKIFKLFFLTTFIFTTFSCSSDDDNCPDSIIVDINDPESMAQAEACGLSPAEPLGTLWVSESYMHKHTEIE